MASDMCLGQGWKISRNIDATVELVVSCDAMRHWSMHDVWTRPARQKKQALLVLKSISMTLGDWVTFCFACQGLSAQTARESDEGNPRVLWGKT